MTSNNIGKEIRRIFYDSRKIQLIYVKDSVIYPHVFVVIKITDKVGFPTYNTYRIVPDRLPQPTDHVIITPTVLATYKPENETPFQYTRFSSDIEINKEHAEYMLHFDKLLRTVDG